MNIVIFAGGTGSIALQTGLYELLDKQLDGIDTKILTNALDNGKSTGTVRQVMDGKILGPSDVRKNQTTRLQLENPTSPWIPFLNTRFTVESSKAKDECYSAINHLVIKLAESANLQHIEYTLDSAIYSYFSVPIAEKMDYTDFSLANIIYAGLAKQNNYSLRKATTIMAELIGIKDNVLLNDDRSLFLGAITKSGRRITDEGDIVSWGNKEDPFVDVFFTDSDGYGTDEVGTAPLLCDEAYDAICQADLIIISSGTLWSSLIPTFASLGFDRAIQNSNAKILMVMNRMPDMDSPGQTASEIVDILIPKYFPEGRVHAIADSTASSQMNVISDPQGKLASQSTFLIGGTIHKHDPTRLAQAIAQTYFRDYLNSDYYMFDYDDTLVGRGNKLPISSQRNVYGISELNKMRSKLKLGICTGNTIKSVNLATATYSLFNIDVYADGGVNKYSYDGHQADEDAIVAKLVKCVNVGMIISENLISKIITNLRDAGIPLSKIDNRGNVIIAIKPIDPEYRTVVLNLVSRIVGESLPSGNHSLLVRPSGRTTVEIHNLHLSKTYAIDHVINADKPKSITYIGDELDSGNDEDVKKLSRNFPGLKCLHVKNPAQTAFFILTLLDYRNSTNE